MAKTDLFSLMYRTQFDMFVELAFELIHPGEQLVQNWHILVIANQLSRFMTGSPNRLIINLPPRSLKSFITSIAMPAFLLGKDPRQKILILAGTSDLANDLRQKVVKLMRSDRYRSLFDQCEFVAHDRRLDFPQGGSLSFLKYGEAIIGKGYEVIIVDDPQSPSQVLDAAKREQVTDYFKSDVLPRLNSKSAGRIVIVQQRLHREDLTGSLYDKTWVRLAVAAVSREVETWDTPRGECVTRGKGIALCESRESKESIQQQLYALGPEKFAAQYLQQPYLGTALRLGSGEAWLRPPEDWDGKERMGMVFMAYPDPLQKIEEMFFDGPPSPYVWHDPNPVQTIEEWEAETILQQQEVVRRANEGR